jgi:hypothetical protein
MQKIKQKIVEGYRQVVAGLVAQETRSLLFLFFIAFAVTLVLYRVYFHFSPYVWSLNAKVSLDEITPTIRFWLKERDGMETYVLYALMFAVIAIVALLARLSERLKTDLFRSVFWPVGAALFLILLACFVKNVGFYPPVVAWRGSVTTNIAVVTLTGLLLWLIIKIAGWQRRLADFLIVLGLLPICLVTTTPFRLLDYSYVFAPALRLIDHFKISEIYFQYDLLLSLIAAAWMKLKLDLNLFQVLAQASIYAFLLGCFFFSRRFLQNRKLSYFLLAVLTLMMAYAGRADLFSLIQVTPFRLGLWIVLLILAYEKGVYSKWLGAALGFLVVFHQAFGIIYTLSYCELIAVLFLLDCAQQPRSWRDIKVSIMKHAAIIWPNALIVLASLALSRFLSGGSFLEASSTYRSLGIGFDRANRLSFYWYVPIVFSATFVLLVRKRPQLGEKYFRTALFLVSLAIGESLYFFGRSHESNVTSISAVLLFVFFVLMDLIFSEVGETNRPGLKKKLAVILPTLFVLAIAFYYSARIKEKMLIQLHSLERGQLIFPMAINVGPNVLKPIVGDSQKVYFMGSNDFYYYYYWNYVPQGHFSPYGTWVYKKDLEGFIQGLLEDKYFIAIRETDVKSEQEILSDLKYAHSAQSGDWMVVWK